MGPGRAAPCRAPPPQHRRLRDNVGCMVCLSTHVLVLNAVGGAIEARHARLILEAHPPDDPLDLAKNIRAWSTIMVALSSAAPEAGGAVIGALL